MFFLFLYLLLCFTDVVKNQVRNRETEQWCIILHFLEIIFERCTKSLLLVYMLNVMPHFQLKARNFERQWSSLSKYFPLALNWCFMLWFGSFVNHKSFHLIGHLNLVFTFNSYQVYDHVHRRNTTIFLNEQTVENDRNLSKLSLRLLLESDTAIL